MQQRLFGSGGPSVPVVGQGTWNLERDDRTAAVRALQRGLDLGLTHVDTAEMYGHGAVEELVGEAIAGRRDEVFLVSKVLPGHASLAGTVSACEATLRRLGTDRLDCFLLHWPGPHPLTETFAAFEKLKTAGKIRSFGVSNFDIDDLEEAAGLVGASSIACNQVLYHLEERSIEHALLPWCRTHGVALVAYSPFGSGRFPAADSEGGLALQKVAEAHGRSPRQVALKFLLRDEAVLVIPKAAQSAHAEDNAGAGDETWALNATEIAALERAFPLGIAGELPTL